MTDMSFADGIIAGLDPKDVPHEYILWACLMYPDGTEQMVFDGDELEQILKTNTTAAKMKVVLDVHRIKYAMALAINDIFESLNDMLARRHLEQK